MTYKIHWHNLITGQRGVGTKEFDEEKARALVKELNTEYPDFEHEARPVIQQRS